MSNTTDKTWAELRAFYISSTRTDEDKARRNQLAGEAEAAVEKFGAKLDTWYDDQAPAAIGTRIAESILASPVVFADLAGASPNVYYEVGIAHGAEIPVICFHTENEPPEFDLADYRSIPVRFEDGELKNDHNVRTSLDKALRRVAKPPSNGIPATAVGVVRMAKQVEDLREELNQTRALQSSSSGDAIELDFAIMELAREGKLDLATPEALEAGRTVVDLRDGIGKIIETRAGRETTARIDFRHDMRTLTITDRTKLYLLP